MKTTPTIRALLLLLLVTVLSYWQILLTRQFSLLFDAEAVNQAYSWLNFWIASIRHATLPLWDPYTLSGHSFIGEMQTAAFYPLHLLLLVFPFDQNGVFSPQLYHQWFAFAHFLGACFMFALVRELGLSRFSAIVGGVCFSLSGFVAYAGWPHMFESAIWLPLIFLFLLRAIRADSVRRLALWASLSGLCLGLSVLAGGLHVVMMQAIVIVTAAAFAGFNPQTVGKAFRNRPWIATALAAAVVAIIGFCAGAVQLLPSMEYGPHALRWLGVPALPATQKIPYAYLGDGLWPHGFVGLLFESAFGGNLGGGEVISPHMGVFPMIAAVIGIWKCWGNLWVRYLGGLALAAFLYSLGSFSLLHGALYALVPYLWMAWEADRFMYLAHFSLAVLAAFGAETLLSGQTGETGWRGLNRILGWCVIGGVVALAIPALFRRVEINPWSSFFILLVFLSYGLFLYILRGHTGTTARLLMLGLILFDLSALNWSWWNKIQAAKTRTDQLERALSCRGAVTFLKSQPGLFRVQVLADEPPNIGDLFQVPAIGGRGTTLLKDYVPLLVGRSDLLNARYLLRPASAVEPGPVYQDAYWKVYENPNAFPRAWVVHEAIVEPSSERLVGLRDSPGIDLHRQALLGAGLQTALEPPVEGASEIVAFRSYGASKMELSVRAESRGLLVLSEIFYPGWRATVNGAGQRIYKVDGGLRGVVVPSGESRVVLSYTPWSVYAGAFLTLGTFLGVLAAFTLRRREPQGE